MIYLIFLKVLMFIRPTDLKNVLFVSNGIFWIKNLSLNQLCVTAVMTH